MCRNHRFLKRLNNCSKAGACIFWAVLNIVFGVAFFPLLIEFVAQKNLPIVVLIFGCICASSLVLSGILLLVGIFKGLRRLVCASIFFSGLGIFFIHWLIIPLVLYFIFSFIVYTYYQVDMSPDDRYRVPRRFSL